jgi:hypothetical protein
MSNPRDLILWLTFGIPTIIQGWFLGAGALMVRVAEKPYFLGPILVTYKRNERASYTTTLAGWINRGPHAGATTMYHEQIHLEQYLEFNVLAAIQAACFIGPFWSWWWALGWWGTSGFLWFGPNYIVALIRYKSREVGWMDACYFWTSHEQDAYARTEAEFDGQRVRWEKR